jgi:hypothetical protein
LDIHLSTALCATGTTLNACGNTCIAELRAQPKEHPLLLTEAPLNPRPQRERAAELLFETFGVPALFVSAQAILSLYASGRTTGLVLDCGAGTTSATPVFQGFALPHAIERVDLAGRDVTLHLQRLLRRAGSHVSHLGRARGGPRHQRVALLRRARRRQGRVGRRHRHRRRRRCRLGRRRRQASSIACPTAS